MPKQQKQPSENATRITRRDIAIGVGLAVVMAAAAIALFMVFVGDSGSGDSGLLDVPPPAGPEPTAPRSAAADLLANKSFDDMTEAERATLKDAVNAAFANAGFRASNRLVPAIDIFRVDDHTRVSRQFKAAQSPTGEGIVVQTLTFYCDSPDGNIGQYQYIISPFGAQSQAKGLKPFGSPFDGTLYGLDWSQVKDLGQRTVDGHRVHGFEMQFHSPSSGRTNTSRTWFDIDTARMILREAPDTGGDDATYKFDWSLPAPVVMPEGQPPAPCAEAFYRSVPSARAADATPVASATAGTTSVATPVP